MFVRVRVHACTVCVMCPVCVMTLAFFDFVFLCVFRIPGVNGACRTLRRETGKSPAEEGARREMSG